MAIGAVTVRNIGAIAAGTFQVGYYLSNDAGINNGDTLLGTHVIAGLNVNATVTLPIRNLTIPAPTPAGTYFIGVFVDRLSVVSEQSETNNTVATQLVVRAALADLFVTNTPTITPNPMIRIFNQQAAFTAGEFIIRNIGQASSAACRVGYYFSTDSTLSTGDSLMGTANVPSLAPGASHSFGGRTLTTPATIAGQRWIGVIVDDTHVVSELNEPNNTRGTASHRLVIAQAIAGCLEHPGSV